MAAVALEIRFDSCRASVVDVALGFMTLINRESGSGSPPFPVAVPN